VLHPCAGLASTPQRLGGTGLGGGAGGGGLLANIGNNGPPRMSGTARPLTARNAAGQPVGPGAARRPSSAPRERSAAPNYTKEGYMQGGGSPADARVGLQGGESRLHRVTPLTSQMYSHSVWQEYGAAISTGGWGAGGIARVSDGLVHQPPCSPCRYSINRHRPTQRHINL
jgi:hypothetical protein